MPPIPPPQDDADDALVMYEQLAAEFLTEQAEVVYSDDGDQQLDQFSDAALADQLVTAWAGGSASSTSGALSRRSDGCAATENGPKQGGLLRPGVDLVT